MEWITLILTVSIVIISFHLLFGKRSHPNAPPCVRGWIPWFGAAFEFGKAPLHFIQQARAKYGPVFTVVAAGKRLTFVTLNEDFRAFFTSKDVDFEQAVQEAVHNTASISKDCFYKTHPTCATVIKGRLTPGNTAMLSVHLCEEFNDHLENFGSEGSGQLNEIINDKYLPNYGLLLLWASLANAIPVSEKFSAITQYLSMSCLLCIQDKEKTKVTLDDLQHMPYVKWCIMEAIRLRAPGAITRKVVRPLKLQNYVIPPGDLLMLSPYWAHRNPKYFPDPEDFKPERWEKADLEKNVHLEGFVAFGGGKNQCPGRWYAVMELHMFVALILYKFEFTPLDPVPKPSPLHLVGTQQPDGTCTVRYKHR
uniref:24-hydroxycholesterol 7-alpha-hydroxylase-like n=1 Tax=Sinocyclocheilus rhinocerous TaxID=307959 RepID=A0A673MGM8_9TELE